MMHNLTFEGVQQIAFSVETGEQTTNGVLEPGVGEKIAAAVLPGLTPELLAEWYSAWLSHDDPKQPGSLRWVPERQIAAIAEVLAVHRWKDMGPDWCSCECGAVLTGDGSLTTFPADDAFRRHLADEIVAAGDRHCGRWITNADELAEHEREGTVIDCADGNRRIFGPYMLWYRVLDGDNPKRVGVNGYTVPMPCSVVPSTELNHPNKEN